MEGDASRPASRKGTPKLSSTSACKQTTSVGRASKISTSIGRCDRVEPDSTPRGSRNGVRSFDDRLLGADDEFLLPRVSESRVSVTESLVAALSKPVSDAVSEAVSEKVKAQLVDLTGRVVEAVCDIQVEVAKACMKDLYHELAARLTSDIVPVLADMSRQLSMPAISVTPAGIMATSMSSAPSMVSRTSTSRSSSYHRGGSGGTLVSNPDDVSTRDVKSLENTLADQLLEDLGLSFSSHGSRAETRRRKKTHATSSESGSGVSSANLAPVLPREPPEHMVARVSKHTVPSAPGADMTHSDSLQALSERYRTPSTISLPTAAAVATGASGAAMAKVGKAAPIAQADSPASQPQAASSKDVVQVTIAVPPVPPLNQGPPEPNTCPRTLELPNAITPPEIQAERRQSLSSNESRRQSLSSVESGGSGAGLMGEVPRSLGLQGRFAKAGRRMTTGEVLRVRIEELTEEIPIIDPSTNEESEWRSEVGGATSALFLAMRLCGLAPWSRDRCLWVSKAYRVFCLFFVALAACALLVESIAKHEAMRQETRRCDWAHPCWRQRGLLSEIPLAASLVAALVLLGVWKSGMALVGTMLLLESYSLQQGLMEKLLSRRRRETRWVAVLGVCAVALTIVGMLLETQGEQLRFEAVMSCGIRLVLFLMLLCLCFCLLYVCSVLGMCADAFCCNVVDDLDLGAVVHEWNVLQAILRKSSSTIELAFVALLCAVIFYLPLLTVDIFAFSGFRDSLPALVPGLVACIGIVRLFFLAAAITDKCTRIPPLMNSLSFGVGTERYRQYIVDYITNSAAGFYVFDVRLSTEMLLKFIYIWGVIAFGLSTQLISQM